MSETIQSVTIDIGDFGIAGTVVVMDLYVDDVKVDTQNFGPYSPDRAYASLTWSGINYELTSESSVYLAVGLSGTIWDGYIGCVGGSTSNMGADWTTDVGSYGTYPGAKTNALSATSAVETMGSAGVPEKATTPFPADAVTDVVNNKAITLTWVDGGEGEANAATSYDVYFGTDLTGPVFQENVETESWAVPENFHGLGTSYLNELQGYEWRIDAVNDAGTTTGDEWSFTTSGTRGLGKAIVPTPTDAATSQSPTIESVAWQNGGGANKYDVYFGTVSGSLSKIETIDSSSEAIFAADSFSAGKFGVIGGAANYWRIDSRNNFGTVTGDEWSFTTSALQIPVPSAQNALATARRLVVAARHKIFYEDL